ncbi:DNA-binding transcriptional regulator, AcrR family [Micromonospora viridifaciens]|uniref:DNA-binding transcriptional regulator, AcrR family n=1 Tax=Micromonospora viridifaciens TaxID=1881 RepID=A0A1C4XL19_MICVI|nr:TetR family transcriptional regulator [Micromonospora viridifaciens]SCF09200.1 DNA-binding transcriptional regulator, AcrR family [Micromonospora viridifaciens]
MDEAAGLRERKKAATRLALHEAALRLAAEQGPERVTVEAIADAANVSRRTFSNYFSSKEEALFYGDTRWLRRLLELLHAEPADEAPWAALSRAALHLAAEVYDDGPARSWLDRRRRLHGHPGLLPHQAAAYAAMERELAGELARRLTGPDQALRARVLAATFLATVRVATQQGIEHPETPMIEVVRAALAHATPASDSGS